MPLKISWICLKEAEKNRDIGIGKLLLGQIDQSDIELYSLESLEQALHIDLGSLTLEEPSFQDQQDSDSDSKNSDLIPNSTEFIEEKTENAPWHIERDGQESAETATEISSDSQACWPPVWVQNMYIIQAL